MKRKILAVLLWFPIMASIAHAQWQYIGLESKQVISLETHAFQSSYIYAGTNYQGLYMTSDGGENWHNKISSNVPISCILTDPHSPPTLFALVSDSWSAGIYNSANSGNSWHLINYLPHPQRMGFDAYHPAWIYITFPGGIITSIEYGYDYQISNYGLPDTNIIDIMAHGANRLEGYALGEAFVAKTASFGQVWEDIGGMFGNEDYNPARIASDPTSPDSLYVTTWAYLARSFDGGDNWEYFETPSVYNVPIVCDRFTPGRLYFGSMGVGVFVSHDAGETFEDITGNLPYLDIYSLAIDTEGRLLAGTDNGVYINDFVTGMEDEKALLPDSPVLNQNYPNPFNGSTRISFAIPEAGYVTITVYDMLGRETRTLLDGPMEAGENSVVFDAPELSSGVYFYRLEAGEFSDTKRLMLIK
ncbi:MAG: T9SS type A sorting domain-containing protein [candidate division Zixibacteria bacterium]